MTKKDFQLIADVLNAHHKQPGPVPEFTVQAIAVSLASELAKTNERFNKERFVKACLKS
jgi:hypothetical protein